MSIRLVKLTWDWRQYASDGRHRVFSKLVEPQAILEDGMVANGANVFRIGRHGAYANQEFSYFPFFV